MAYEGLRDLILYGRRLSPKSLDDYASTGAGDVIGRGRQAGAEAAPVEPARIYASELLDTNTCGPCGDVDGKEYASLADSLDDYPAGGYIGCLGGARCRGTRVFVWPTEAPPTAETPGDRRPPGAPPPGPVIPPAPPPTRGGQSIEERVQTTRLTKAQRATFDEATAAIGEVHNVIIGGTGRLPIKASTSTTRYGAYRYELRATGAVPKDISITFTKSNPHPRLTAAHELGHFIDHVGLFGQSTRFASSMVDTADAGALAGWWDAVKGSRAVASLKTLARPGATLPDGFKPSKSYIRYLLGADELFARSYAQYIATRSSNAALKAELTAYVQKGKVTGYAQQWDDDEFEPIAEAFDRLFEGLGWKVPE